MPRLVVRPASSLLLAIALSSCAGRHPIPDTRYPILESSQPTDVTTEAAAAQRIVALFIGSEAQGNDAADTLLAPGADFVLTGVRVTTRPRLAGLNGPGQAEVEEAGMGLSGSFAWVVTLYRFTGRTPELGERARATFILEKQRAGWKIRHVHSSMVARW